eukprot:1443163-Amphidinium_carterae.1
MNDYEGNDAWGRLLETRFQLTHGRLSAVLQPLPADEQGWTSYEEAVSYTHLRAHETEADL